MQNLIIKIKLSEQQILNVVFEYENMGQNKFVLMEKVWLYNMLYGANITNKCIQNSVWEQLDEIQYIVLIFSLKNNMGYKISNVDNQTTNI